MSDPAQDPAVIIATGILSHEPRSHTSKGITILFLFLAIHETLPVTYQHVVFVNVGLFISMGLRLQEKNKYLLIYRPYFWYFPGRIAIDCSSLSHDPRQGLQSCKAGTYVYKLCFLVDVICNWYGKWERAMRVYKIKRRRPIDTYTIPFSVVENYIIHIWKGYRN